MPTEKTVEIRLDQDDFEQLRDFKNDRGLTWEGVLKHGVMFDG